MYTFILYLVQTYFKIFVHFLQLNGMCNRKRYVFIIVVKQDCFKTPFGGIYEKSSPSVKCAMNPSSYFRYHKNYVPGKTAPQNFCSIL